MNPPQTTLEIVLANLLPFLLVNFEKWNEIILWKRLSIRDYKRLQLAIMWLWSKHKERHTKGLLRVM